MYLDMTLQRTQDNWITTTYYHKPTSQGRLLNFNSTHAKNEYGKWYNIQNTNPYIHKKHSHKWYTPNIINQFISLDINQTTNSQVWQEQRTKHHQRNRKWYTYKIQGPHIHITQHIYRKAYKNSWLNIMKI